MGPFVHEDVVDAPKARQEPGVVGRHLHFAVMWGLALAVGVCFQIGVFALVAMSGELADQNDHACSYHRDDWRANERVGWFAAFMLATTTCWLFAGMPWAAFGWQVFGGAVYGIGQCVVSHVAHDLVHGGNPISNERRARAVMRVLYGSAAMFWGINIAL